MDLQEPVDTAQSVTPATAPALFSEGHEPTGTNTRLFSKVSRVAGWLFGLASLILGLATLAAVPLVQFFVLGYLLEAMARIVRTGRLREALFGVRFAGRLGEAMLGIWLVWLPVRLLEERLAAVQLIDPASSQVQTLERILGPVGLLMLLHILVALARGGRLWWFFRPLSNLLWLLRGISTLQCLREAWGRTCGLAQRMWEQKGLFWLGIRGYVGTALWLVLPSALLAAGTQQPGLGLLGGILLAWVLLYLPFLQAHFAAERRLGAFLEVGVIRERFRRSPIAFLATVVLTSLLSLPLYVLKIEFVPQDVVWLPTLVFIVTILPLKLLAGWSYGRACRQDRRSWRLVSWPCRLVMLPAAAFYAFVVFLSQYTAWHGAAGVFEHHAFLLPVPF